MQPIKKYHTNSTLHPVNGDESKVLPLHITRLMDGSFASVWKVSGWREWVRLLFTGEITFITHGITHPPVNIHAGDVITIKGEKE